MIAELLRFLAGDLGLIVIGLVAALTILVWDWRATLVGILFVQIGLAAVAVVGHDVALEWLYVQTGVLALACMILALSARQARLAGSMYHAGAWTLRLAALVLGFFCWQLLAANASLPLLRAQETRLVVWLALMGLLMTGLGDSPYFTGVGLLLWLTLVQFGADILLSIPALIAMIGMLELLLALACSYLILVERVPETARVAVMTDITFPDDNPRPMPRREDSREETIETPVVWGSEETLPAFSITATAGSGNPLGAGPKGAPAAKAAPADPRPRVFGRTLLARKKP